ncbi:class I SAM-dependent methyltransferase [Nocardioides bigeumensis]|uniref:Class I SAM-dependent methyltransferase n=1 Tax=Nocardioides bigeumensis TaxID=433657 RepID=A0ABN2YIC7_9ACTN
MPDEIAASAGGCVVCGPEAPSTPFVLTESMFGSGERFDYHRCDVCGSMQIDVVPEDLARHYDPGLYSSFNVPDVIGPRWQGSRTVRALWALRGRVHLATGLAGTGMPWLREAGAKQGDRVLDLGCGDGHELSRMRKLGFRRLEGADPFLDVPEKTINGVRIVKAYHQDLPVDSRYDLVVMHHAFEHVPDPRATLRSVRRVLAEGGSLLVRMPVMGQEAWDEYGVDWAQLDPPRHLVVYTLDGARRLFEEEGFRVVRTFFDSHAYQFVWSDMVRRGIPFADAAAQDVDPDRLAGWEQRAARLNAEGRGDQAGYVLEPLR